MNKLQCVVASVSKSDMLTKIDMVCDDVALTAFTIDIDCKSNCVDKKVTVLFKESEVSIAKNFVGEISLQNRFTCKIQNIQEGELLAQLRLSFLNYQIDSIISMKSVKTMDLQVGDNVMALVKSTEMIVMDIDDE